MHWLLHSHSLTLISRHGLFDYGNMISSLIQTDQYILPPIPIPVLGLTTFHSTMHAKAAAFQTGKLLYSSTFQTWRLGTLPPQAWKLGTLPPKPGTFVPFHLKLPPQTSTSNLEPFVPFHQPIPSFGHCNPLGRKVPDLIQGRNDAFLVIIAPQAHHFAR